MPSWFRTLLLLGILAGLSTFSGCTSSTIADVGYGSGNYSVAVDNTGPATDAYLQVTAFRLSGWSQEEYLVVYRPVTCGEGHTIITLPAELPPGRYKLYAYLVKDGNRLAAVIRDIEV